MPPVTEEKNHPDVSNQRSAYKPIEHPVGNDKGRDGKGQNGANVEAIKRHGRRTRPCQWIFMVRKGGVAAL